MRLVKFRSRGETVAVNPEEVQRVYGERYDGSYQEVYCWIAMRDGKTLYIQGSLDKVTRRLMGLEE